MVIRRTHQRKLLLNGLKKELSYWLALCSVLSILFVWTKPIKLSAHNVPSDLPSTTPADEVKWQSMANAIRDVVEQYPGEVGIYIKDLKTGKVFEKDADGQFVTASLIKVPIMVATFQAMAENRLSLGTALRFREKHRRGGSGKLKWSRAGRWFLTSDLIYRMVTHSDNTATAIFIDRFGYDYFNDCFEKFGLSVTRIDPVGMTLANQVDPARENYTTPREMGDLLEKIYRHELVTPAYCDLMIEIMKHAEGPSRLAKFLPKNWSLARKGGLLRKNCHDCGIVFMPKTDYVICVMTGRNETYKKAKGFIAAIGQAIYPYMDHS